MHASTAQAVGLGVFKVYLNNQERIVEKKTHTFTPVFPEGLGRGAWMYTHSSPVCFRSHVIGGEPIAINRAQNLTHARPGSRT